MYPLHKNETGSFQELAHSADIRFGQLSILKINHGCTRGGHYHTRKEEWFCCIHGKCELRLNDVKDGSSRVIMLDEANREFVKVKPYENHVITNLSDLEECELLVIISEKYNSENPDTFKYEG
jgi:UDP-2-acetamido-2,6-beta-L-arabino-hexul-4-ose reductase